MGIDPGKVQNPKFQAALQKALAVPAEPVPAKTYTLSGGLLNWSTIKSVVVPGVPMGKPRMTQRDQWVKRPVVVRYRQYCDLIRATWKTHHGDLPDNPDGIMVVSCFPVPPSWPRREREAAVDCGHRNRPDADNVLKGVCDALFEEDSIIWVKWSVKFWCAPGDEGTHVSVLWYT